MSEKLPMPPSILDISFEELEARLAACPETISEEGAADPVDIHKLRAAEKFGVAYEDVTPEQRRIAKRLNHLALYSCSGLVYGEVSAMFGSHGTGKSKLKF